ncbi:MAG: hypothetical protein A3K83_00165 [Omnitrophica WOR_2 bacterium RBG_13_44_8b]|nr:MAG: hypothetical protein A3K83_00165 [Omnitrophica WOR_2 bacterium RBG_13_44_8b]
MTISDWLVIAAIVIAPILAVQIQKFIESKKEKRARKMQIFRALMATRATPLYPQHVEALNMIDIEFFENKKITDAWKLLLDNFANYPKDPKDTNYQAQLNSSMEKSTDLLVDLLYEMAKHLNYKFDKVHIKRGAYIPKGHADYILDQEFIRRALVGVLLGQVPIPIKVVNQPE